MVNLLLGRGEVSPDRQGDSGQTLFSYTAKGECEGVVNPLLKREEVNLDKPEKSRPNAALFCYQV